MSAISLAFAQLFRGFSGTDPSPLVLHLETSGFTLSEIFIKKRVPQLRFVVRQDFERPVDLSDLAPDIVRIQELLERAVVNFGLVGRDVMICAMHKELIVRVVSMFFMSDKELAIESQEPDFWKEHLPEIGEMESPHLTFKRISADEAEDTMALLVAASPRETLTQFCDIATEADLKPVLIDPEPLALVNSMYRLMTRSDRRSSIGIIYLSESGGRVIGIAPNQIDSTTFEFNEFDQVLLKQLDTVDHPSGDFWAEVGARIGSAVSQSCNYLVQEGKFLPFRKVVLITGLSDPEKTAQLLKTNSDLPEIEIWSGSEPLGVPEGEVPGALECILAPSVGTAHQMADHELYKPPFGEVFSYLSLHPYHDKLIGNRRVRASNAAFGLLLGIALMAGFAYTALVTGPKYLSAERAVGNASSVIQQASGLKNQVNGLNQKISAIKKQSETLFDVASQNTRYEFFDVFPSTVPPGIALSEFNLDRDGALSIQGVAQSADLVTVFTDNLIREQLMTAPKLRASYKESGGDAGFRFELYGQAGQK